jgi:hypothetical protein
MFEITQYLFEKFDWLVERILKHLTGETDYEVQKVEERIPPILPSGVSRQLAPPDTSCDRY